MEFSRKKISTQFLDLFLQVNIEEIQPYSLMNSPVYIHLKENKKLISVKEPLDFFTPVELEKLKASKEIYLPTFVNTIHPFIDAAKKIRILISSYKNYPSYELSEEIFNVIGPLWQKDENSGLYIEPFLITIFGNALCDLFPLESLIKYREKSVKNFEVALFRSSWCIFLALHLGYFHIDCLHMVRENFLSNTIKDQSKNNTVFKNELEELFFLVNLSMDHIHLKKIYSSFFKSRSEKVSQKIISKLKIIEKKVERDHLQWPTIYGEKGFTDG